MSESDDDRAQGASPVVDTTVPSIARAYDAVLGGKDNYEIDRVVREQLLATAPELGKLAWDNRSFLIRATRFLAGQAKIDQFLDCGSGLPTVENTHEAAQRINHEAQVVYVDNDAIVSAHGRALLEENEFTSFVAADFRRPRDIFDNPTVAKNIDFDRPLGFYHVGTLHHLADDENPGAIMAENLAELPSGSYVVLSHFVNPGPSDPEASELAERLEQSFLNSPMGTGRFRTPDEIQAYFGDLEMINPGLVPLNDWWPDGPTLVGEDPVQRLMVGGVAKKA